MISVDTSGLDAAGGRRDAADGQAKACPIYESAGSVKAFRWDFLGFVRPFEHTFTSG
jgi:hypothetical protein